MDDIKLYQGDCLELFKNVPDKSVDLVVTDPPYNISKSKEWDKYKKGEYIPFMGAVFKEVERVLKDNGSFYWFHNDFLQIVELQNYINQNTRFVFKQFITWNKRFDGARNKGFLDGFVEVNALRNYQKMAEYCMFYTFQDDTGLSQVMLDVNNFSTLRRYFKEFQEALGLSLKKINISLGHRKAEHAFYWNSTQWDIPTKETYTELLKLPIKNSFVPREYESLRQEYESLRYTFNNQKTHHSVWNFEIAPKEGHITPKPVELIENIIIHSSNPGDTVLDCFLGSGTTLVACAKTGRKGIGFERNADYFKLASERIARTGSDMTAIYIDNVKSVGQSNSLLDFMV